MDVSVETGKEAMSNISAALNVAEMCFYRSGSHRIMCGCDFFQLQQRLTVSYDSPAPAFWQYSVHLFLQAGAPAQTLSSSKCLVRGSLPDEIGRRGQAAHRVPAVAGAEKQCECKPQAPTTLWGGCTRQPGLSPGGLDMGTWLWHSEDELVRGTWAFQV